MADMEEKRNRAQQKQDYLQEEYPKNLLLTMRTSWELDFPEEITKDMAAGIEYVIFKLEEREQQVIRLRYKERKSYAEIGKVFQVTGTRVQQIEARAFRNLRFPFNWSFIKYGVSGMLKKSNTNGYKQGYKKGYFDAIEDFMTVWNSLSKLEDKLDQPIKELPLPSRAVNALFREGYTTVKDIVPLSSKEIREIKNLGKSSAQNVAKALQDIGVKDTDWDKYLK